MSRSYKNNFARQYSEYHDGSMPHVIRSDEVPDREVSHSHSECLLCGTGTKTKRSSFSKPRRRAERSILMAELTDYEINENFYKYQEDFD